MADVNVLAADPATLAEDINDFLEENPVIEIGICAEDYDQIQRRIEDLRSQYRGKHMYLKKTLKEAYKDQYEEAYTGTTNFKRYIKYSKSRRKMLCNAVDVEVQSSVDIRETKFNFLEGEVTSAIKTFTSAFTVTSDAWKIESDVMISRRKAQLPDQLKGMKTLSVSLQSIKSASQKIADAYKTNLEDEVKSCEIEELKEFNKAQLNMKLNKFGGYKSSKDIYAFKIDIEKIYRTIALSMLPDTQPCFSSKMFKTLKESGVGWKKHTEIAR